MSEPQRSEAVTDAVTAAVTDAPEQASILARYGLAPFRPAGPFRLTTVQSMMASMKLRRWLWRLRGATMARNSQRVLVDAGDGVRLVSFRSIQPYAKPKGQAILLHGWEGCHDSAYLYSMACRLHDAGYEVIRLNLRDHGFTHHLNAEPFHSGRIDEAIGAVLKLQQRFPVDGPRFVAGFSLGGNFALRIARHGPARGLQLDHVLAICPAINPLASLEALDNGPSLYRRYFMRKFRRSRRAKQRAFPHLYNFHEFDGLRNFEAITALFAERHTEYGNLASYLDSYAITADRLAGLPVHTVTLAAVDDPVVPIADFAALASVDNHELLVTEHGGHCGFIRGPSLNSWAEDLALAMLAS